MILNPPLHIQNEFCFLVVDIYHRVKQCQVREIHLIYCQLT